MPRVLPFRQTAAVAFGLCLLGALAGCADDAQSAKKEPSLASVVSRLNQLAQQCDADHDHRLTADEQKSLVETVSKLHGALWGERVKKFLDRADANHDGVIDEAEWKQGIAQLQKSGFGPSAGGRAAANKPQTQMVAMRDGVKLATDVYLPAGQGPFPVLLSRTPYDKSKASGMAPGMMAHGIAVVCQDMRGRFQSEGENLPFLGCGTRDHHDGVDTVAWIRKQPWCNGKLLTSGGSALGITQLLMAADDCQGLTAQYIGVAVPSQYGYASYIGGALVKSQIEGWLSTNKFDPRALELILAHPNYDDYWRQFDTTQHYDRMDVPAVLHGGWFDTFQQGTIDAYIGRQHQGGPAARGAQKLVIGPWDHSGFRREGVGELVFPNARMPDTFSSARWIEYHLLGVDNGVMKEPAVQYFVMGDTRDPQAPGNVWRQADDWPVPCTPTSYYFHAAGTLDPQAPAEADAARQYTFDPADPCPTIGGCNLTIARGPKNQNRIETRPDVLLFSTAPLAEPLEVTGRVRAKVFLAASTPDTDLSVRLCDVYPDGKSYLMAEGMLRMRFRNSQEKPEPLPVGQIVAADVDCWSTSLIFNRGHRVRVTLTSSNLPRFDVNPGTGQPGTAGGPLLKQTNRIYCDAQHASCIVLPIGPGEKERVAQR